MSWYSTEGTNLAKFRGPRIPACADRLKCRVCLPSLANLGPSRNQWGKAGLGNALETRKQVQTPIGKKQSRLQDQLGTQRVCASATASAPAGNRNCSVTSLAARHTVSATSDSTVTADGCAKRANTFSANGAYASGINPALSSGVTHASRAAHRSAGVPCAPAERSRSYETKLNDRQRVGVQALVRSSEVHPRRLSLRYGAT